MSITRQQIIEKIKNNDTEFFTEIYHESYAEGYGEMSRKILWEINWGDGNEWNIAYKLLDFNIDVLLEGYYSSHGDSEFSKVSFAVPFEFKETRYRSANAAEIREMKIDEILG
jgi:hypothetical protein